MTTCHCCNGEVKKSGRFENRNRIVQRYCCKRCNKTFSEQQPLDGVRIETDKAAQVVQMLCEGVGIRAISRITLLDQKTVLNVLETAGEHCARLLDAKVRNVKPEQVEVDELYSFVYSRPDNTPKDDQERGEFYCYLSLDRASKLIISHHIGKRNGENVREFLRDLKQRIPTRFQLSSDGWTGYTGIRHGVSAVFGDTIDYGSEIKEFGNLVQRQSSTQPTLRRFNPIVCKWVKRTVHIGEPDVKKINTSRVERLNLSVRIFNRRFTRLTIGYSKTLENHKAAAALFAAHYNFCRVHSAHKQTPAHAAGLTDHAWTVKELLTVN